MSMNNKEKKRQKIISTTFVTTCLVPLVHTLHVFFYSTLYIDWIDQLYLSDQTRTVWNSEAQRG